MPEYLVLDVGGSGIKHAIADAAGNLRNKGVVPTTFTSHPEFIEAVGALYDPVAGAIEGIAISTAGELDPVTGFMHNGGALTFNAGTNMIEAVTARCPTRVSVENDANCALLAETADGALTGCTDAVAIVLGTGIGGAVMLGGRIRHGAHQHAGHFSLLLSNLLDADPLRPLAVDVGVGGLTRPYAEEAGLESADGRAFFAALAEGHPGAVRLLDDYARRVAALIFNAQLVLDVEAFAIGGGISVQPTLIEAIRTRFDELIQRTPAELPRPRVLACKHFNDANLRGALVHHLRSAG